MTSSYQVVWKGPVKKASGLGIASREYVKALRRQGVSTAIGAVRGRASKKRKVLVYHYSPNTLKIQKESSIARQFRHLFAEKGSYGRSRI